MIGSLRNDDWAVSRAADCTLVTMKMVVRVAETLKGPSAEPPTTPCWYWRSMRSLMRAVSRAADYTLMTMKMVMSVAETKGPKRRLRPFGAACAHSYVA